MLSWCPSQVEYFRAIQPIQKGSKKVVVTEYKLWILCISHPSQGAPDEVSTILQIDPNPKTSNSSFAKLNPFSVRLNCNRGAIKPTGHGAATDGSRSRCHFPELRREEPPPKRKLNKFLKNPIFEIKKNPISDFDLLFFVSRKDSSGSSKRT